MAFFLSVYNVRVHLRPIKRHNQARDDRLFWCNPLKGAVTQTVALIIICAMMSRSALVIHTAAFYSAFLQVRTQAWVIGGSLWCGKHKAPYCSPLLCAANWAGFTGETHQELMLLKFKCDRQSLRCPQLLYCVAFEFWEAVYRDFRSFQESDLCVESEIWLIMLFWDFISFRRIGQKCLGFLALRGVRF